MESQWATPRDTRLVSRLAMLMAQLKGMQWVTRMDSQWEMPWESLWAMTTVSQWVRQSVLTWEFLLGHQ